MISPAWMALLAKIFSPERRGSFLGLTMFIGVGIGILGSGLSAWLLETLRFPVPFTWLFLIAAFFTTLSWVFLGLTRKPEGKAKTQDQDWKAYWNSLLWILRKDNNFRRYVISNIIVRVGGMGTAFMTVSAIHRFKISDATVGIYSLVMLVVETIGYLVLGRLADRFGHKLSVEIGVL